MWGWVFVAPQFIGLLIFALIPLVMSFVISFHDWDGIADTMKFVGVKNYVHQVMDSDFQKALVNTVIYSIMYIPLNIVLALILALAVQKIKGKTLYRLFYFMPVVTGSVSVGVIWTWILNGDFGLLNSVLAVFEINGPKWLTDTHMVLLSIVITWYYFWPVFRIFPKFIMRRQRLTEQINGHVSGISRFPCFLRLCFSY